MHSSTATVTRTGAAVTGIRMAEAAEGGTDIRMAVATTTMTMITIICWALVATTMVIRTITTITVRRRR